MPASRSTRRREPTPHRRNRRNCRSPSASFSRRAPRPVNALSVPSTALRCPYTSWSRRFDHFLTASTAHQNPPLCNRTLWAEPVSWRNRVNGTECWARTGDPLTTVVCGERILDTPDCTPRPVPDDHAKCDASHHPTDPAEQHAQPCRTRPHPFRDRPRRAPRPCQPPQLHGVTTNDNRWSLKYTTPIPSLTPGRTPETGGEDGKELRGETLRFSPRATTRAAECVFAQHESLVPIRRRGGCSRREQP